MKFRPLHDWVVIKRSKPVEMTTSGIIIPDTARDKPSEGIVSDVGPGRYKQEKGKKEKKFFPTVLKPGQKVMFIDYMAKDVELDGTEITLIREDDVLGIVEQSGELTVKKEYHVELKKEQPPMVQAQPEKAAAAPVVKKQAKAKKEKKAKPAKTPGKPAKKEKKATVKKPAPKAPTAKKTAAKKTVKKAAGKKTAPKKTAAGKAPARKTVPVKTAKKGSAKKTAPIKTVKKVAAKKTAPKKTAKKTRK